MGAAKLNAKYKVNFDDPRPAYYGGISFSFQRGFSEPFLISIGFSYDWLILPDVWHFQYQYGRELEAGEAPTSTFSHRTFETVLNSSKNEILHEQKLGFRFLVGAVVWSNSQASLVVGFGPQVKYLTYSHLKRSRPHPDPELAKGYDIRKTSKGPFLAFEIASTLFFLKRYGTFGWYVGLDYASVFLNTKVKEAGQNEVPSDLRVMTGSLVMGVAYYL